MKIHPQILYGANGEAKGVYLTMEDWKTLSESLQTNDIPAWIVREHEEPMKAIQNGTVTTIPAEEVIKKLHDDFDVAEAKRFVRFQAGKEKSIPAKSVKKNCVMPLQKHSVEHLFLRAFAHLCALA